jgi:hypothetical protein
MLQARIFLLAGKKEFSSGHQQLRSGTGSVLALCLLHRMPTCLNARTGVDAKCGTGGEEEVARLPEEAIFQKTDEHRFAEIAAAFQISRVPLRECLQWSRWRCPAVEASLTQAWRN